MRFQAKLHRPGPSTGDPNLVYPVSAFCWVQAVKASDYDALKARVKALEALIEKIARCEVPASNEFATRMTHWCQEAMEHIAAPTEQGER